MHMIENMMKEQIKIITEHCKNMKNKGENKYEK